MAVFIYFTLEEEMFGMMSKTHFAVGLATSLAIIQPKTFNECAVAVIGGTVGGVLADNDIESKK